MDKIKNRLEFIYGKDYEQIYDKLKTIMDRYKEDKVIKSKREKNKEVNLSEKDSILITYGDSVIKKGEKPLVTLHNFLKKHVGKSVSGVHILPFYPYSSDDGFSVIDYKEVNPELGDWEDIQRIGREYRLMADLVVNHMSAKSEWFKKFLEGDEKYKDYFISFEEEVDTSSVFRPRMNPLLTKFDTAKGEKYVWTTFSEDQVDLNFSNPEVFLEMIEVLLFYISNYIEIIRLDAIGFLWKELGTNCFHLPKTHEMVKLFRDVLEEVAPYVVLITETNVPYQDNVSYFGEDDEAHMVYQFSYPPLVLDAFLRKDSKYLQKLFKRLEELNYGTFFNFLASHDGVGVLAARDFLTEEEFEEMLQEVEEHKGHVSYKATAKGKTPYEMNINYFDAINDPNQEEGKEVEKFLASQSVIVFSKGVPGIYIHSFIGSRNDYVGVEKAKVEMKGGNLNNIYRRINREKVDYDKLEEELGNGRRKEVLEGYKRLLEIRGSNKDFDPFLREKVIDSDERLLILEKDSVYFIVNFSNQEVKLEKYKGFADLISGEEFDGKVKSYQVLVLK